MRLGDVNEARASLVSILESLATIEGPPAIAALGELDALEEEAAAAAVGAPLPRVAPAETAHALTLLAALELQTVGADAGAVWAEVAPREASEKESNAPDRSTMGVCCQRREQEQG